MWDCLGVLFGGFPLSAQFSGRVTGTVVDASGAAVPGADVELFVAGGKKAVLTVKTSADGSYHFIGVRPADYDLSVQAKGFVTATLRNITVDAARETDVPQIKLQLATRHPDRSTSRPKSPGVETSSAEISGTISMADIRNLPILDRDPLGVLQTQPGVVSNGNSTTVINGLRTSYSNMTLDGINIQDNYIRDNALDYTPNKLLLGQVRQMTLVSSNGNAASFGGATETAFSTPSGGNQFHGEAFWYNRNNYFAANDWFNNQSGIGRPFLNQNQFGGSLGGPIRSDKAVLLLQLRSGPHAPAGAATTTILTAAGAQRHLHLSRRRGRAALGEPAGAARADRRRSGDAADPGQVPGPQFINSNTVGDGLNTGGYRFNQRDNEIRDNVTGKLDYNISTRHALSGSYAWNRDNSDRPDAENDYSAGSQGVQPDARQAAGDLVALDALRHG